MFSFFCASSSSKMNLSFNYPGTSASHFRLTCSSLLLEDTVPVGHIDAYLSIALGFSLCFAMSPYSTSICSTDLLGLGLGTVSPFPEATPHHQPLADSATVGAARGWGQTSFLSLKPA